MKLSTGLNSEKKDNKITWVGNGLLGICNGGHSIRILNLNNDENYSLTSPSNNKKLYYILLNLIIYLIKNINKRK